MACIILLTAMFSINKSSVLAANEKSIGQNGKAFGALLKEASKKVADVKVVKFKYYYRPSPFVTNLYGVTSVHSVVLLDFNKYTAKMKSIVYYKDSNGNSNRAKVICKKDMQIDDCVFKFEDEIKNNAKLKKNLENVLSGVVFYLFDTSNYHNVGDFIFYPWQQGAYLYDAKYTKKKMVTSLILQNGLKMADRRTLYTWITIMTFIGIGLLKKMKRRRCVGVSLCLNFSSKIKQRRRVL